MAEWLRVEFNYPRFEKPPAVSSAFAEVKATLTPRMYAAVRGSFESNSKVVDTSGDTADHFLPNRQAYEVAIGYRVNRVQTLKFGYELFHTTGSSGTQNNVFGVQFVTSIHALSKAF